LSIVFMDLEIFQQQLVLGTNSYPPFSCLLIN
jgi:hypothetical protein